MHGPSRWDQPAHRLVVVGATGWIGGAVRRAAAARALPTVAVVRAGEDLPDDTVPVDRLPTVLDDGVVVINAAGLGPGTPEELHAANVLLCDRIAAACQRAKVPLLTVGSAAEYGVPISRKVPECHPERPVTPYGRSKLEATNALRARGTAGLRFTVARVFNVVGPGRRGGDPVQEFAEQVWRVPAEGGVVSAYDSTLVRDVASVGWVGERLLDLAAVVGTAEVVNVCTGHGTSFRDLIDAMAAVRGVRVTVQDTRPGGVPSVVGDPELLHRLVPRPALESVADLARSALAMVPSARTGSLTLRDGLTSGSRG